MNNISKIMRNEAWLTNIIKRFMIVMGTVILPVIIAIVGAFNSKISDNLFIGIMFFLGILQLACAFMALAGAQTVQAAYFQILDIEKKLNEQKIEFDSIESQVKNLLYLQASSRAWGRITTYARENGIQDYNELRKQISNVLSPICNKPGELFGCESDELWNVAVYLYDSNERILFPIWRERHRAHPSQNDLGRQWRPGEGHIGKAFADRSAKITKDAHDPDVSELMAPPETATRPYDNQAYRSYASIPFFDPLGRVEDPWGVIVVTSNSPGRFDRFNTLILQHVAIAIADLIGVLNTPIGDIRNHLFAPAQLPTNDVEANDKPTAEGYDADVQEE